ncbi:uncharacterized protein [Nicotiana sylvestris]|uniref:uncharacterized protein n=1 Tax=Nicotiana sylvestris TaxID=4096 RepID=UPI00388CA165
MANQEFEASIVDPSKEVEESEVNLRDELYKLKQQMAEMYQAWVKGHPPPVYPANPAFIPPLAQPQELPTGGQVSVAYKDLCLFPDVQLSAGFKMPKFDLYDGHDDPMAHLKGFCSKMRGAGGKDELLMAYFSQSLSGSALEWWREQVARVDPPMKESEMVDYFLHALEPAYYGHLVSTIGKSFNEVVKMSNMVKEGLKTNKIMSYSTIKVTTQAIQSGTGGVIGKKKKEDVAMIDSGAWFRPRGSPHHYHQSRPHHQTYPYTPYNPPQHYYAPPDPHFSVHHAQTYSQPPAHAQWRALVPQNTYPTPQNAYLSLRAYGNPPGSGFRPNQEFKNERLQKKKAFTPLGESYTSLFHRLRQLGMLSPIEPKLPNPPQRNLDHSMSCEYYFGALGHDIEKCWQLKTAIQELIDTNRIEVQAPEVPNINQNPLPAYPETNMIKIVHRGGDPKKASQTVMMIRSSEVRLVEKPTSEKSVIRLTGANSEQSAVIKKGTPSDVAVKQERAKVVVPGVANKPILIMEGAHTDHVIIKPILNEAHVPDKISVNHLEKIDNKIFKVNRVTFSDHELLVEGTEHNRALYLTVKYNDSVVTRVLVDYGSSANICPLSTLNKLNVDDERIHKNSICIRGFNDGGKDSVRDIVLELTIGPVEFTMEFQVLDVAVYYNLMLGRPWIHAAKEVLSTLHQMGPWVYPVFDTVSVEKIPEGKCVPTLKVVVASVMVAVEMLKNGFVPGKGLGASLQGIVQPVSLLKNLDTFGLGFKPTVADIKRARKLKQRAWVLPKPIQRLYRSFFRPSTKKRPATAVPSSVVAPDKEFLEKFEKLLDDMNMVEAGEGSSK